MHTQRLPRIVVVVVADIGVEAVACTVAGVLVCIVVVACIGELVGMAVACKLASVLAGIGVEPVGTAVGACIVAVAYIVELVGMAWALACTGEPVGMELVCIGELAYTLVGLACMLVERAGTEEPACRELAVVCMLVVGTMAGLVRTLVWAHHKLVEVVLGKRLALVGREQRRTFAVILDWSLLVAQER